jgi:hypothetical protein
MSRASEEAASERRELLLSRYSQLRVDEENEEMGWGAVVGERE